MPRRYRLHGRTTIERVNSMDGPRFPTSLAASTAMADHVACPRTQSNSRPSRALASHRTNLEPLVVATRGLASIACRPMHSQTTQADEMRTCVSVGTDRSTSRVDFLLFPVIDWDHQFQRPQHIASELARRGHRVLYFRTTFTADVCSCDSPITEVAPSIYVAELPGGLRPPNVYQDIPTAEQIDVIATGVARCCTRLGFEATVSIVDYPFWAPIVERLSNTLVLYDCMDDYASFPNAGPPAQVLEGPMIRLADVFVCSSQHLLNRARGLVSRSGHLVRNGVDLNHFVEPPREHTPERNGKTVGYVGAMGNWTDIPLLEHCATTLTDHRFVFVGPTLGSDISSLAALPNVEFLGPRPYAELPRLLHGFDVCLLPYAIGDYALASDPVKVWEYLAAGKPVVARRFAEIERLSQVIELAETPEEFAQAVRVAIETDSAESRRRRVEFTRQHTWSHRVDQLLELVRDSFPLVSLIVRGDAPKSRLDATLHSIETRTHYPNLEIILLEPTAGQAFHPPSRGCEVQRIPCRAGETPAIVYDRGMEVARGEYCVLLDGSLFVTPGWVQDLLSHFRRNPRLGLLGPVTNWYRAVSRIAIDYPDIHEMLIRARRYTRVHRREHQDLQTLTFFCTMLPRALWDSVGPFDERSDTMEFDGAYCHRARLAGYEVACAHDVFVHHAGEPEPVRDGCVTPHSGIPDDGFRETPPAPGEALPSPKS